MLWSLAPWTHRMREDSFIFLFDVLPTIQSIPQGNNLILNLNIYHFLPQGETTHHWKQHCQVQSKLLQNGEGKTDHFVTFHAERCDYDWHGNDHCCLGVSLHLGNMGRAFLEPSTLSIFTPHLYPGIIFECKLCLPILFICSPWWQTSRTTMSQGMKMKDLVAMSKGLRENDVFQLWPIFHLSQVQFDHPARDVTCWGLR